jgi:hypothetical protein
MRTTLIALMTFLILLSAICGVWAYDRGHVYINGKVEAITTGTITIDGQTYDIEPDCRVILNVSRNGAVSQRAGRLADIALGDKVYARLLGRSISEIQVGR